MIIRRSVPEGTSDRYREGEFSKDYSQLNELGRGRFAVVRRCEHISTKQHFAAKFIKKRRMGRDCKEDILKEIKILEMSMAHPRLITLHEIYETAHEVILVLEFAVGGELHPYCVAERDGTFTERDAVRLLLQIVEGIKYLHDQDIVHLDIKPQNILLTGEEISKGDIKLIDFGIARWLNRDQEVREIVGTVDYVAPEVLNYEPISLATDMWSVGVVAYVMLTGVSPFAGDTKQETYLNISQGNLDFPEEYFKEVSLEAQDLIKSLCVLEPEERLTADECIKHPLFISHLSEGALHIPLIACEPAQGIDMGVAETEVHVMDHNDTVNGEVTGDTPGPQGDGTSETLLPKPIAAENKLVIPDFGVKHHTTESPKVHSSVLSIEVNDRLSESDAELDGDQHKMQVDHHVSTKVVVKSESVFGKERTVLFSEGDIHMLNDGPSQAHFEFGREESVPGINGHCSSSSFGFNFLGSGKEGFPSPSLKHPHPVEHGRLLDCDKENILSAPEPKRPKLETPTSMVVSS